MPTRATVLWLLAYLAVMAALVAGLAAARRRVLATLDTPEAGREWLAWKEKTVADQQGAGPVRRKTVRTNEPPALILFRDRFAVIVVTTVLIGSFLFGFLAFVGRGACRGGRSTT